MNHRILIAVVALLTGLIGYAAAPRTDMLPRSQVQRYAGAPAPESRAGSRMLIGEAGDYYSAQGVAIDVYEGVAAMILTPELQQFYAGCTLTGLRFTHGPMDDPTAVYGNLFISRDLQGDIVQEQQFRIANRKVFDTQDVMLDKPLTFSAQATDTLYIGWTVLIQEKGKDGVYPFAYDYGPKSEYTSDFFGYIDEKGNWLVYPYRYWYMDFCLWGILEGDNFPENDVETYGFAAPRFVRAGEPFDLTMGIRNYGANEISSVDVTVTAGSEKPVTVTVPVSPMSNRQTDTIAIPFTINAVGSAIPLTAQITKVNGQADPNMANNVTGSEYMLSVPADGAYPRTVVIEEGTGTWCGYCPEGILSMDYLAHKYRKDGRLLQVAVHCSGDNGNDIMTLGGYREFADMWFPGLPLSTFDRYGVTSTDTESMERMYLSELACPSLVKIDLEATPLADGSKVTFDADITFAAPAKGNDYKVVAVVIEDSVGPYWQQNYYKFFPDVPMGGWEKKELEVEIIYNDVAVGINNGLGQRGLLPETIAAGQTVPVTLTVGSRNAEIMEHCRFGFFLVNALTGRVENAALTGNMSSATLPAADALPTTETTYDLLGRPVNPDTAPAGIYIRRNGNTSTVIKL